MINPRLLQYIKKQLLKGVSRETIVQKLLDNGWAKEDIEDAFMLTPLPVSTKKKTVTKEKGFYKSGYFWFILVLIFLILVMSGVLTFAWFNEVWFF